MNNPIPATHRRKAILTGFAAAWGIGLLVVGFFIPSLWKIEFMGPEVALILMGTILVEFGMSLLAGYFWIKAEVPLRLASRMALLVCLPVLIFFFIHPNLGIWHLSLSSEKLTASFDTIFSLAVHLLIFRIASLLGVWFGYRFFSS